METITHSQANYRSSASYSYDVSPTPGNHRIWAVNGTPYSSPAGSFPANGYGLSDMAGNVWEWGWDGYGSSYHSTSPSTDPQGSPPGSDRVMRGGGWENSAYFARAALRWDNGLGASYSDVGFRSVRR